MHTESFSSAFIYFLSFSLLVSFFNSKWLHFYYCQPELSQIITTFLHIFPQVLTEHNPITIYLNSLLHSIIYLPFTHLVENESAKLLAPFTALKSKQSYPHSNYFHKHKRLIQSRSQHASPSPCSAPAPQNRSADEQSAGLSAWEETSKERGGSGLQESQSRDSSKSREGKRKGEK